jgi:DNA-binding NarL/FixJ family response regulator
MSSDAPVRIVLVDDHPMFRDGLRKLLESDEGFRVCGEAGDVRAAVATVTELTPDIVLLDMAMRASGLEVLRLLGMSRWRHASVLTASIGHGGACRRCTRRPGSHFEGRGLATAVRGDSP